MDFMSWGAAEWGAFGQVGALIVATIAGLLVWLQVRHGRQVREDQTRPYVIVDFEFQGMMVMISIRNIGTTPARDVRISFDKPLRSPYKTHPDEFAVFSEGIPMLAPGRTIRLSFGIGHQFFPDEGEQVPLRYEARVEYKSLDGKKSFQDPPLVLDLLPFKHSAVDREDLHQIYQNLKDIKNLMKSWTREQRLRVSTITQAEVDQRHKELWEARQAKRAPREAERESDSRSDG